MYMKYEFHILALEGLRWQAFSHKKSSSKAAGQSQHNLCYLPCDLWKIKFQLNMFGVFWGFLPLSSDV